MRDRHRAARLAACGDDDVRPVRGDPGGVEQDHRRRRRQRDDRQRRVLPRRRRPQRHHPQPDHRRHLTMADDDPGDKATTTTASRWTPPTTSGSTTTVHPPNDGLIDSRKDTTQPDRLLERPREPQQGVRHRLDRERHRPDDDPPQLDPRHQPAQPQHRQRRYAHLYNNHMQNITCYGNYARGATKMVLENSTSTTSRTRLLRHRRAGHDQQRLPQHDRHARVTGRRSRSSIRTFYSTRWIRRPTPRRWSALHGSACGARN